MSSPAQVYSVTGFFFLVSVLMLAKLLKARYSWVSLVLATVCYAVLTSIIALWAARLDLWWLSPEHVFGSVWSLVVPASVIFVVILWLISGVALWKAVLISAVSHVILLVVSDFAILSF